MLFSFGKYIHQDVKEVAQTEEGEQYCKWIVNQRFCPKELYDYLMYDCGIMEG